MCAPPVAGVVGRGDTQGTSRSPFCPPPPLAPHAGPDRDLFLPSGLLDPSDVPAYLNGELPGE